MYLFLHTMRSAIKLTLIASTGSMENCVPASTLHAVVKMSSTIRSLTTRLWELMMYENPALLGKGKLSLLE